MATDSLSPPPIPVNTELLESLKDVVRICEAMRYTTGLGKNQLERIAKARVIIAKAEGRDHA